MTYFVHLPNQVLQIFILPRFNSVIFESTTNLIMFSFNPLSVLFYSHYECFFVAYWFLFFKTLGNSLAVQWLRLLASTAGGKGLIPGQETKIPQAMQHGQNVKKKKKKTQKTPHLPLSLTSRFPGLLSSSPTSQAHSQLRTFTCAHPSAWNTFPSDHHKLTPVLHIVSQRPPLLEKGLISI